MEGVIRVDFQIELGDTLDGTLHLFAKKNLCAEEIIRQLLLSFQSPRFFSRQFHDFA